MDKLDAVAEGVAELEAAEAGDRDGFEDLDVVLAEAALPGGDVVDVVGEVGFGRGAVDVLLDADVELKLADGEPEAAAGLEGGGLWDLAEAEDVAIEAAGVVLAVFGDGDLGVVEADD